MTTPTVTVEQRFKDRQWGEGPPPEGARAIPKRQLNEERWPNGAWERVVNHYLVNKLQNTTRPTIGEYLSEEQVTALIEDGVNVVITQPKR